MPHTYSALLVHAVFATRGRAKLITPECRPRLHAYLGGILRNLNALPIEIGGIEDHVHMLFALPLTAATADIMRVAKCNSSAWMQETFVANFSWQRGYSAFTVSPRRQQAVAAYVRKQEEHHRTRSFDEEYRELLQLHGIVFDERFIWT